MVLALFASVLSGAAYAEESKPNVMFIAVDDLNDWVGYLKGHPQAKTPNIDKFSILGTVDFRDRPIVDYELDPCFVDFRDRPIVDYELDPCLGV